MVDRIEYNVEKAATYVESAKKETRKALTYQRSARRVRCHQLVFRGVSYNIVLFTEKVHLFHCINYWTGCNWRYYSIGCCNWVM